MFEKYIQELIALLKIKSISGDPAYRNEINEAAQMLHGKLESLGFQSEIRETSFLPVITANRLDAGNGKPTILIYGHYDVQPEGELSEWNTDPFIPEIKDGNIYGRGTADDKGQLYTWIAAIEEIVADSDTLPVNIKFLIEGAEEMGSEGLDEFVEKYKDLLEADVCVISDSHSLSEEQPMICYGLRGLTYMQIEISTLRSDVHSGLYGGNVSNPAQVLAHIIAQLKHNDHSVAIPGFYDDVRKLDQFEREDLAHFPFTESDIKNETGAEAISGEVGYSIPERAGARPTLDVNGIWGGYQGEGAKTIIPAKAGAKISMRLVPYQKSKDIEKKFTQYVQSLVPEGAQCTITPIHGTEPIVFEKTSQFFRAAEKAYKKVFENDVLYELSGGSIGVTESLKRILGIDSILMGYGLPDDNLHGPNEKLSVAMFEKGIKTNIEFLSSFV